MYPAPVTDIYRLYVNIHYQLVPYLLTTGSDALENNRSSLTPLAKHESYIDRLVDLFEPATYAYLLGRDILVTPIVDNKTDIVKVDFPAGSNWVSWFNASLSYTGGTTAHISFANLTDFPVYHRSGALLPLNVTASNTGAPHHGDAFSDGALTILLDRPSLQGDRTHIREYKGQGGLELWYHASATGALSFTVTAHPTLRVQLLLQNICSFNPSRVYNTLPSIPVRLDHHPSRALLQRAPQGGVYYDPVNHRAWIRPAEGTRGVMVLAEAFENCPVFH